MSTTTTPANEPQETTQATAQATPPPPAPPKLVTTVEGEEVTEAEAAMLPWCQFYNQHTTGETRNVYTGDSLEPERWSRTAIRRQRATGDLELYNGEYYTFDGLEYFDLVRIETGGIMHVNDAYQHSDGLYYSSPEDVNAAYVRDYHNDDENVYTVDFTHTTEPRWRIGYEIEKEDRAVKESINIDTFESTNGKWRKEADGSLNRYTGYELISPAFELNADEIRRYIESRPVILKHVNADYSTACGGHIHLSDTHRTGRELFMRLRGYVHLLHGLYYGRTDKASPNTGTKYAEARSIESLYKYGRRFQSVNILEDRLEFRIFGAVRNLDNLHWRTRLIEHMIANDAPTGITTAEAIHRMYTDLNDDESDLCAILKEVYTTPADMLRLTKRVKEQIIKHEGYNPEHYTGDGEE